MPRASTILLGIVALVLLAMILFVVYALVAKQCSNKAEQLEEERTYSGSLNKWFEAMDRGDSADAIHWARQTIYFAAKRRYVPGRLEEAHHCLALAYEVAGQFEDALAVHEEYPRWPLDKGRVYYKLGKGAEASDAFCEYTLLFMERRRLTLPIDGSSMHVNRFKRMFTDCAYPCDKTLSPFVDYQQFWAFMGTYGSATRGHDDYRKAMEFIGFVASGQKIRTSD